MTLIDGPRLAATGRRATGLVVFLHGYGADGNDLIDIGRSWQPYLPGVAFVSPHAPEPCGMSPMGRQWFALTFRDDGERWRGVVQARPALDAFLDAERDRLAITDDRIVLVGFSQGTMMALHVGVRRPGLGAIVGYSGCSPGRSISARRPSRRGDAGARGPGPGDPGAGDLRRRERPRRGRDPRGVPRLAGRRARHRPARPRARARDGGDGARHPPAAALTRLGRLARPSYIGRNAIGPSFVLRSPHSLDTLFKFLVPALVGVVGVVLLMGLANLMRGGSSSRSQMLMRWRIGLQFVAIVVIMTAIWWRGG